METYNGAQIIYKSVEIDSSLRSNRRKSVIESNQIDLFLQANYTLNKKMIVLQILSAAIIIAATNAASSGINLFLLNKMTNFSNLRGSIYSIIFYSTRSCSVSCIKCKVDTMKKY